MTNDDILLAGFLDRSLSEDQLLELEARKAASPEFAHQFSNMLTVEGMLASATPKATIPADFLHAVENTVAAKVLVGGGAAGAGGFLSGLSSAWSWLGGAALGLVIAGSVYYLTLPETKPVVLVQSPDTPEHVISQPMTPVTDAPLSDIESTPNELPGTDRPSMDVSNANQSDDGLPQKREIQNPGIGGDLSANSPSSAVALAVRDYEAAVRSGDLLVATQNAITLGKTFREQADLTKSREYFVKAVEHARKAKFAGWEIEALGEQAKTSVALGNQTEARLLLNQAISRGSITGTDVSVWTQMLQDLR